MAGDAFLHLGDRDLQHSGKLGVEITLGGVGIGALGVRDPLGSACQRFAMMVNGADDTEPFDTLILRQRFGDALLECSQIALLNGSDLCIEALAVYSRLIRRRSLILSLSTGTKKVSCGRSTG